MNLKWGVLKNMSLLPINVNSLSQVVSANKQVNNLEGFDFLRAFFSIAIVALHAELLKLGPVKLSNILVANVAYLAVPVFFQISLFLFYIKSEVSGSSYFFKKRLPKLVSLYLFWVTSKIIFDTLLNGNVEALRNNLSSPRRLFEFIVSGCNSPLYFFFSLIFITFLTEIVILLVGRIRKPTIKIAYTYFLLILACALIVIFGVCSQFVDSSNESSSRLFQVLANLGKWDYNPLNFLPYIFTASIAVKDFRSMESTGKAVNLKPKVYTLLFLFILFSFIEWKYFNDLLHYARLSLVFGSWLLLYFALLSNGKPSQMVKFISGCSLGIYTLHLFFTHGLLASQLNVFSHISQLFPGLATIAEFLVALFGSVILTLIFRRAKFLRRFV
ncbi:acyltransferase [Leptothermofonsia sichuanensis E412]|uniref:acyltransferase n=1 Tax=Leptothermofonsia sichuanensis TaxID=2917832 RepID=UPI001CA7B65A|nr:acyltransferase [Leptothermofonsia sichuanensis]QZZ22100.1 acyltransferase [Leptothermofonsia sichuanensis E412]